jgi:hypothetical protein
VVVGANKAQRRSQFTARAHARINTSRQTKIIMTSPAAVCVFAVLPLAEAGATDSNDQREDMAPLTAAGASRIAAAQGSWKLDGRKEAREKAPKLR